MLNIIVSIFLIVTLIIQIISMLYLIINMITHDKEDKKFWNEIHKKLEESLIRDTTILQNSIAEEKANEQNK